MDTISQKSKTCENCAYYRNHTQMVGICRHKHMSGTEVRYSDFCNFFQIERREKELNVSNDRRINNKRRNIRVY